MLHLLYIMGGNEMDTGIIVPVVPRNMFSIPKLQLYCFGSLLLVSIGTVDIICSQMQC